MAKKISGLGRGLDAIFLENSLADEAVTADEDRILKLKISLIDPKRDQPRKYFDKEALEELSASIAENGLLQPILVREYGEGRYQIIGSNLHPLCLMHLQMDSLPLHHLESPRCNILLIPI